MDGFPVKSLQMSSAVRLESRSYGSKPSGAVHPGVRMGSISEGVPIESASKMNTSDGEPSFTQTLFDEMSPNARP